MACRALADAVLVVHLAFIVFVAVGSLLAWRWPRLVWAHLPATAWAAGIVTIGWNCPLTPLEKWLRRLGDDEVYRGGFVDRYVEGVVYPEELTPLLRALAATAVVLGYMGLLRRRRGRSATPWCGPRCPHPRAFQLARRLRRRQGVSAGEADPPQPVAITTANIDSHRRPVAITIGWSNAVPPSTT